MNACLTLLLALVAVPPADAGPAAAAPADVAPADVAVVCPAAFRPALAPWVEHRAAQGHRFAWIDNRQSAADIKAALQRLATGGALRFVVLVGDADPAAASDPAVRARSTPTHHARAEINVHWGSEPEIATDHYFADLDDDGRPDLAVGRLPADTPAELALLVRKTLAYEQSLGYGPWRRRVNFVAGVGGFGALVDTVIETAAARLLTEGIPAAYQTSMTYGSWRSPFCPDPRRFHECTLERLNEGCLFWVYIGHGHRRTLDRVHSPLGRHPIFAAHDTPRLAAQQGPPIVIFLACYTGAFDHADDCLAEEVLRSEAGPVAVLAGSRVTMPYGMAVLGMGLMDEHFRHRRETLGEVLQHAKRRLATSDEPAADAQLNSRQTLDLVARAISPLPERLADERREHALLFNLLGDPLLRLHQPSEVAIEAPPRVAAGQTFTIEARSPLAGRATVELVCRRDRAAARAAPRPTGPLTSATLAAADAGYQQANDDRWCMAELDAVDGKFTTTLTVPSDARGHAHVRVYIEGATAHALGAVDVYIVQPAAEEVRR